MPKPNTERRLWEAFSAESAAAMRYTLYAQAARREGYQQIGDILEETASNEQAHARLWLMALGALPNGDQPGDTLKNLRAAAQVEHKEWNEEYKQCAQTAQQDGESALEKQFEMVAAIEASHEERFQALIKNLEEGAVFSKPQQPAAVWRCRFCGHLHAASEACQVCPVCGHPQAFFELEAQNY